eukprot:2979064-Alexandrium_andersonii.AAC.1
MRAASSQQQSVGGYQRSATTKVCERNARCLLSSATLEPQHATSAAWRVSQTTVRLLWRRCA